MVHKVFAINQFLARQDDCDVSDTLLLHPTVTYLLDLQRFFLQFSSRGLVHPVWKSRLIAAGVQQTARFSATSALAVRVDDRCFVFSFYATR